MSKPLRNPKHEKFAQAIIDRIEPAQAYVDAGFVRDRANHWKLLRNPRVHARIAELTKKRETVARAARVPVVEVLNEFEKYGIDRLADFYQSGAGVGELVVRDLRAVKTEIALALLNSLHEGFGVSWDQSAASSSRTQQQHGI